MDYCTTCRRHLNGALICPGCGELTDNATKHHDETDGTAALPEVAAGQDAVVVHHDAPRHDAPNGDQRGDHPGDHRADRRGDDAATAAAATGETAGETAGQLVPVPGGRRAAHRAVRRNGRRRYLLAAVLGVAVLGVTVAEVGDVGLPPALNPIGSGRESEAADTPTTPEATAEASESADAPVEQVTDSASTDPEESPSDAESTEESPEETTQPPVEEEGSIETSAAPTTSAPDPETSGPTDPEPDSPSPSEPGEPEPEEPEPSPTEDDCWWIFC